MDGDTLYSIGELARRTGLTVKTIRFYSDRGIVTPAGRSPGGYRRYHPDAVARLDLVRTLRELGLGLDATRRVLDRELPLAEIAAEHAAALEVQIRILRLRRAVLNALRNRTPEEIERMHPLARLTEAERERLIDDFLDEVFTGLDGYAGPRRSMTPELPDDPTDEQLDAWVELAELSLDPDFRATLRDGAEGHAATASGVPRPDLVAIARDHALAALDSGIRARSPEADRVLAAISADCARSLGRADDDELRRWMLERLTAANDPRRDRYLHLLALINGWSPPQPLTPALDWSVEALRVRAAR